jgi:LAO/AO transport system kinase
MQYAGVQRRATNKLFQVYLIMAQLQPASYYIDGIGNKDRIILSQAITIIESNSEDHTSLSRDILQACRQQPGKAYRIGITGVPGVGKSTFINAFAGFLSEQNKKIAVLAVDPTSSLSQGSILGDKTRMEDIAHDPNVYIRPTPAGGHLGGIARRTRETIILCEAFGFDHILIETVGVGQSETAVKNLVDFFLLLTLPNAGDELQGIKRGIMELADAIVVNKAEGDNEAKAKIAAAQIKTALHYFSGNEINWTVPVLLASALEKKGIAVIYESFRSFITRSESCGFFAKNRGSQNWHWFEETWKRSLQEKLASLPHLQETFTKYKLSITTEQLDPYQAAQELAQRIDIQLKD